ncbi:MAG: hypothetical protein Q8K70_06230 [Bacteroidota bacterium]|nr:hypothetical protein [Bacteroidota bacterium]
MKNFVINSLLKTKKYYWLILMELISILVFVNYSFESNDDTAINILLSGSYTGTPTEYVYFINIILADFIKTLYEFNNHINWYNVVLIFYASAVFVFINMLNYQKQKNNSIGLYAANAIFYIVLLTLLSSMNFSKFAVLGIVAGIIPILFLKINSYQKVFSLFLVVFGAMIRLDLIYFVLVLLMPVIVYFYKRVFQNISYLAAIGVILCCTGVNMIHKKSYSSNNIWSEYQKHFETRKTATNYDNNRFNISDGKKYLEEVKWTENDFYLISNFMWDLGVSQMEYEKLEFMTSKLNVFTFQSPYSMLIKAKTLLIYLITFLFESSMYLAIIFLLIILYRTKNFKLFYFFILSILYVILVLFILNFFTSNNIYKDRIIWSAFLPIIMSVLFLSFNQVESNFKGNKIFKFIIFFFCLIGFIMKSNMDIFKSQKSNQISISEELNRIFDKPYIHWVGFDLLNVFSNPPNYSKAIMMGWFAGTPHNLKKIHDLCGSNDAKGIYDIKNTEVNWVFYKGDEIRVEMVKNFYYENFKVSHLITSKLVLQNGVELIKLSVLVNDNI